MINSGRASSRRQRFPRRRFVEARPDVVGGHYNLSGVELARRLALRALQTDASHPWARAHAPRYIVGDRSARADAAAAAAASGRPARARPSDMRYEPGVGIVRFRGPGAPVVVNAGRQESPLPPHPPPPPQQQQQAQTGEAARVAG